MNDRDRMESAIRGMQRTDKPEVPDPSNWFYKALAVARRTLASLRIKVSGTASKPKIEITGGTDF